MLRFLIVTIITAVLYAWGRYAQRRDEADGTRSRDDLRPWWEIEEE